MNAKYFFVLRKEKRENKTSLFGLFMIHSCYRFVCEGEEDDLLPEGKRYIGAAKAALWPSVNLQ